MIRPSTCPENRDRYKRHLKLGFQRRMRRYRLLPAQRTRGLAAAELTQPQGLRETGPDPARAAAGGGCCLRPK